MLRCLCAIGRRTAIRPPKFRILHASWPGVVLLPRTGAIYGQQALRPSTICCERNPQLASPGARQGAGEGLHLVAGVRAGLPGGEVAVLDGLLVACAVGSKGSEPHRKSRRRVPLEKGGVQAAGAQPSRQHASQSTDRRTATPCLPSLPHAWPTVADNGVCVHPSAPPVGIALVLLLPRGALERSALVAHAQLPAHMCKGWSRLASHQGRERS